MIKCSDLLINTRQCLQKSTAAIRSISIWL